MVSFKNVNVFTTLLDFFTFYFADEKPKHKLPDLDKYWKAVKADQEDFNAWTYLLQYVDSESDVEAAREAYDSFLSRYSYCYGYWRKYADYEKKKGSVEECDEVS